MVEHDVQHSELHGAYEQDHATQVLGDVLEDVLEGVKFEGVLKEVYLQEDEARNGEAHVRTMNVGHAARRPHQHSPPQRLWSTVQTRSYAARSGTTSWC